MNRVQSKLEAFFMWGFQRSQGVVQSGFVILFYSAGVIGLSLSYIFLQALSGAQDVGVAFSYNPISLFPTIFIFIIGGVFVLSETANKISHFEMNRSSHLIDIIFGLVMLLSGIWAFFNYNPISFISEFPESSDQLFLLGTGLLYVGSYTVITGILLNGFSRVALHILAGKTRALQYVNELRPVFSTIWWNRIITTVDSIRYYRRRRGLSHRGAVIEIFALGLSQIEPQPITEDGKGDQLEAEERERLLESFRAEQHLTPPLEKKESWHSLLFYVLAVGVLLPFFLILPWKATDPSSFINLYRMFALLGLFSLLLGVFPVLRALVIDSTFIHEEPIDWNPRWWRYTAIILISYFFAFGWLFIHWGSFQQAIISVSAPVVTASAVFIAYLLKRKRLYSADS